MSASIIKFKTKAVKKQNKCTTKGPGCKSPIVVERFSTNSVFLLFSLRTFSTPFLEYSLRGLAHGEEKVWRLYRMPDNEPLYVRYAILLNTSSKDRQKATEQLTTIVDRVCKKVYAEELRLCSDEVSVSDLSKPYTYRLNISIEGRTRKVLESYGIKNARTLAKMTREQLCELPGLTTDDVVKIEKSLASRGIFLTTAYVPA